MEKKTHTTSEQTKQTLGLALKELMVQKPLDKITIHELTERCGMRRQNFYYHFEDVYDLLRWVLQEEAISLLRRHEGTLLWQEGLLQLFQYLEENRAFCLCALHSVGRDHIRRFFEADIDMIIHRTVEQIGSDISQTGGEVSAAEIDMVTHFYVLALAGTVESWILGEMDCTPEQLIAFVDTLLQDTARGTKARLERAACPEG